MILPEGVGNREWLAKRLFPCDSVALLTCHLSLRNLRDHMPTCIYRDPLADCTLKNSSSAHEVLSREIFEGIRNMLERKISCCFPVPYRCAASPLASEHFVFEVNHSYRENEDPPCPHPLQSGLTCVVNLQNIGIVVIFFITKKFKLVMQCKQDWSPCNLLDWNL